MRLFVANTFGDNVTIYPSGATGNVPPVATLSTGIISPQSVTVDNTGKSYVINGGTPPSVSVYAAGATGPAAPLFTISGSNTKLDFPIGSAVDSGGRILVTNISSSSTISDSVLIFSAATRGNMAPVAMIGGAVRG